jgi:hypothetical protein
MGQPLYLSALFPGQPYAYHCTSLKRVHFITMLTQLLDVVLFIRTLQRRSSARSAKMQ